MPLTLRPAASRAPVRSPPHHLSHFLLLKYLRASGALKGHFARLRMNFPLRQARCRQCVVRAHLLQQAKRKCRGWQQKMPRCRWRRSARGARRQGSLTAQEGREAAESKQAREREQGSQTSSGPAGMPAKKIAGTLGRRVTRNTQPMPLTSWPAASCASLRQVPNGQHQFSTHKIATHAQR
jgi:hypothetical protein